MKLLLTGDSIIARPENHSIPELNFQLQKFLSCNIYNTAISGINSGGLALSLPNLVFNQPKCNYLIILVGTNDLATHKQVPLRQFEKNLELIASSIIWLYYPEKVIFITPPAVDENKQRVRNNRFCLVGSEMCIRDRLLILQVKCKKIKTFPKFSTEKRMTDFTSESTVISY